MQVTCFLGNHPNITELKFPDILIFQRDKLNFLVICKHEEVKKDTSAQKGQDLNIQL